MRSDRQNATRRRDGRSAQSVVEYAIILSLVALLCVALLRTIGTTTSNSMNPVNDALAQ